MVVLDLFPGAELGDVKVVDTSFSLKFHVSQPKHPELLPLLEEKLRGLLKDPPVLEAVEMAKEAAHAYFMHHDQLWKAHEVLQWGWTMIPMVRSGSFFDMYRGALYQGSWQGVAFQLMDATVDEEWIEVIGTAFTSKDELKAFIKKRKQWLRDKPWENGQKEGLFLPASSTLLPKGVALHHQLENFWRKAIASHGLNETVLASRAELSTLAQELGTGVAEWAGERLGPLGTCDLCHQFVVPQQMISYCISSLQFIDQTFKMLQLSASWVLYCEDPFGVQNKQWKQEVKWLTEALKLSGFEYTVDPGLCQRDHPIVELKIKDTLGEQWTGPFLTFSQQPRASIEYSLLGSTKRIISLLAEHTQSAWPVCLTDGKN